MTIDEAMALWTKADRAGEDAYVEAIQAGAVTADDAHKTGSLAAATVIQQAFAGRDGEIVEWLRDRSEAVFDAGYHDKALALDDAADAIECGEHRQALAAKGDSRG